MPPKKGASKSPAKGARKRSVSRARSKSPGRKGKATKSEKTRGRSKSKSPGRKGKAAATASPSPAKVKRSKVSLSPPAKKATSPKRIKRPSTPPRKYKQSPSPAPEKKQARGRRSVAPAPIAERAAEIVSTVSKKVNGVKDSLKKKAAEVKEKVTTTETTTTKREKKEEKKVTEKKGSGKHYEFGGPVGAFLLSLLLPAVIVAVNIACTKKSCSVTHLPEVPTNCSSYYDVDALQLFGLWFVAQVVFAALPLGRVKEGLPLSSGKRLKYRCNGFLSLLLSAAAFGGLYYIQYPLIKVLDVFLPLSVTAIAFALVVSVLLYIRSRYHHGNELAAGGNTGNVLYDFFVGHELNPRIRNFDLKIFFELHFGPIAWAWFNAAFVLKAYQETDTFPPALLMVTACQLIYIADGLWFEENVLSTMDVASDGCGFLNVLGNVAWVPFLYTLQGRYLLDHPQTWSYWALGGFLLLYLIGFFIYRGSNWQKHVFLTNPQHRSVSALETIPGTSGHRLLVGGWWGICRHPNYLGDLIIALAWTLPCGFDTPLPYFYPLNLLFLLIHRASRDGRKCRQKFGAGAWDRYCQRVKYRIVPYVY